MNDKRALVTGASEGIGRCFAKKLAQEGYTVTVVARSKPRLESLIEEMGGGAHALLCADLSTQPGIDAVAEVLRESHFKLLVNNAGFGNYGRFHEVALDKHAQMLQLNCHALMTLSHVYLAAAQPRDALINLSSTLAFLPMPSSALYAASKAMVTSFSEALWFENKDRDVYVMGLCPGMTETEFNKRAGGLTRPPPAVMTQTAEQVVDVALTALQERSRPTVVCGEINNAMAGLTRFMPRKAVVSMMGAARL